MTYYSVLRRPDDALAEIARDSSCSDDLRAIEACLNGNIETVLSYVRDELLELATEHTFDSERVRFISLLVCSLINRSNEYTDAFDLLGVLTFVSTITDHSEESYAWMFLNQFSFSELFIAFRENLTLLSHEMILDFIDYLVCRLKRSGTLSDFALLSPLKCELSSDAYEDLLDFLHVSDVAGSADVALTAHLLDGLYGDDYQVRVSEFCQNSYVTDTSGVSGSSRLSRLSRLQGNFRKRVSGKASTKYLEGLERSFTFSDVVESSEFLVRAADVLTYEFSEYESSPDKYPFPLFKLLGLSLQLVCSHGPLSERARFILGHFSLNEIDDIFLSIKYHEQKMRHQVAFSNYLLSLFQDEDYRMRDRSDVVQRCLRFVSVQRPSLRFPLAILDGVYANESTPATWRKHCLRLVCAEYEDSDDYLSRSTLKAQAPTISADFEALLEERRQLKERKEREINEVLKRASAFQMERRKIAETRKFAEAKQIISQVEGLILNFEECVVVDVLLLSSADYSHDQLSPVIELDGYPYIAVDMLLMFHLRISQLKIDNFDEWNDFCTHWNSSIYPDLCRKIDLHLADLVAAQPVLLSNMIDEYLSIDDCEAGEFSVVLDRCSIVIKLLTRLMARLDSTSCGTAFHLEIARIRELHDDVQTRFSRAELLENMSATIVSDVSELVYHFTDSLKLSVEPLDAQLSDDCSIATVSYQSAAAIGPIPMRIGIHLTQTTNLTLILNIQRNLNLLSLEYASYSIEDLCMLRNRLLWLVAHEFAHCVDFAHGTQSIEIVREIVQPQTRKRRLVGSAVLEALIDGIGFSVLSKVGEDSDCDVTSYDFFCKVVFSSVESVRYFLNRLDKSPDKQLSHMGIQHLRFVAVCRELLDYHNEHFLPRVSVAGDIDIPVLLQQLEHDLFASYRDINAQFLLTRSSRGIDRIIAFCRTAFGKAVDVLNAKQVNGLTDEGSADWSCRSALFIGTGLLNVLLGEKFNSTICASSEYAHHSIATPHAAE